MIVGAIDFGTAYSGWAFSFKHVFDKDPTKVSTKQWCSGAPLATEKAPTCALIAPDGKTLVAFGYDAENKYRALAEDGEQENYYYFKGFKMALNKKLDQVLDRHITIEDNLNRSLPAMGVFSLIIDYLVKDMVAIVKDRIAGTRPSDIHWVLTVPALWTDSAKQFMTEAAIGAGISEGKWTIALEPEAASIYCRYLQLQATKQEQSSAVSGFQVGTKYMVVDAGGGTIDITVHEVDVSGGLKEVFAAVGGGWGGTLVNQAYESFIKDLVTKEVYNQFILNETEDWLDLCRDFETKKKVVTPSEGPKVTIKLPSSLIRLLEKNTNQCLEERIKASKYSGDIKLKVDKLRIEASVMQNLFSHSVDKTINHITSMLRHKEVRDVTALLMVGGFSDSPMLQHAIKSTFPNLQVIIPGDAASVVLKGAVICGHVPDAIRGRILKYTYGYCISIPFLEGVHPEANRITNDHGTYCKHGFEVYVNRNDSVTLDQPPYINTIHPQFSDQTFLSMNVYATQSKPPLVLDQSLTKIGKLRIELEDHEGDIDREVGFSMNFQKTTIEAQAKDMKTGKSVKATLNFLG